jgi:hypothetical protein
MTASAPGPPHAETQLCSIVGVSYGVGGALDPLFPCPSEPPVTHLETQDMSCTSHQGIITSSSPGNVFAMLCDHRGQPRVPVGHSLGLLQVLLSVPQELYHVSFCASPQDTNNAIF